MLIPEHQIEEILERIDIVAFVSRYVELKKSGRSYKGRCPFHEEKTPSFYVTPDLRRFKCFGCQVGGDAIAFAQRYLGKSFVDAVRELAHEVGVDIRTADDPSSRERRQLKEATDLAATHFTERLRDPEVGRSAREYLQQRGVDERTVELFGLGWAPLRWNELSDRLMRAGILEWGIAAGLVQKKSQGDGYFDVFRGRLMIPIRSPEGRTVAFGGRLLEGDSGPKYLNSRESLLYNKSDILYGMDQAREEIRKHKAAVLVEGYFDCIALHHVGIKNAVALCSTALTPGHLSLLGRGEAKELYLLFDGDEAGRKAVERLAGSLLAAGSASKVALLPEKEDPDTFARKNGEAATRQLLESAQTLTEHLFKEVLPRGTSASFEEKMKALDRLKPVASQLPVGLTRSAFFASMGAHFGLPAVELERSLRGKTSTVRPVPKPTPPASAHTSHHQPAQKPTERAPESLETAFAGCVARDKGLLSLDSYRVSDQLRHPALRVLVEALASGHPVEDVLFEASETVRAAVERAMGQLPAGSDALAEAYGAICRKLKLRWIDEQLRYIADLAAQTEGVNDLSEETRRLQSERVDLLALRRRVLQEVKAPSEPSPGSSLES